MEPGDDGMRVGATLVRKLTLDGFFAHAFSLSKNCNCGFWEARKEENYGSLRKCECSNNLNGSPRERYDLPDISPDLLSNRVTTKVGTPSSPCDYGQGIHTVVMLDE